MATTQHSPRRSRREKSTSRRLLNVRLLLLTIGAIVCCLPITYFWHKHQVERSAQAFLGRATQLEAEGKWSQAAAYRGRFLQLHPSDVEQRTLMIEDLAHSAKSPSSRKRLSAMQLEAVGLSPDNHELRVGLADNLLNLLDFSGAESQSRLVLAADATADQKKSARRVLALALLGQAKTGGEVSYENVLVALQEALVDFPGDVPLAASTATFCREHAFTAGANAGDAVTLADEIMNQLVAHDPKNADALLTRYSYRVTHGLPDADSDLDDALKVAPDHIEAQLMAATKELKSADGDKAKAEQYLRRVIEVAPQDSRGYTSLAQLLASSGNRDGALQTLKQGRDKVGKDNIDINMALLAAYRSADDLDNASQVLLDLDDGIRRLLPDVSTANRMQLENVLRLERAQLELARGELSAAVRNLRAVISATGEFAKLSESSDRFQALVLLAQTMGQQGRWDLAAGHWATLTQEMELEKSYWENLPDEFAGKTVYRQRHYSSALAFFRAGQPAEAIKQLERNAEATRQDADAYVLLMQSHFLLQMRYPANERNWSEFLTLLAKKDELATDRWEPVDLESDYWVASGLPNAKDKAVQLLQSSEERFSDDKNFWRSLIANYIQLGAQADAERALTQYTSLETDIKLTSMARATYLASQNRVSEAEQVLSAAMQGLGVADRIMMANQRLQLLRATGRLQEAEQLVTELITENPKSEDLLTTGIEIALSNQAFEKAAQLEEQLASLEVIDDFPLRFLRARRLLAQFAALDTKALRDLAVLINSLHAERPNWYPVVALNAAHFEKTGNRRQAIIEFERANKLGDGSIETLQNLVTLLTDEGRSEEASSYLARLSEQQPTSMQADSLAISTAVKQNRIHEALQIANEAVEGNPDEILPRIWLANLLLIENRIEEAEKLLSEANAKFPADVRVANALVNVLARSQKTDEAKRLVAAIAKQDGIDPSDKRLFLAQSYESLGELDSARDEYEAAISAEPNRIDIRLRYAKLLASTDITAARQQFEAILKLDKNNVAAKQQLAALLAATGQEDDWNQAIRLIQAAGGDATQSSTDDYRLRAIFLTRRGKTRAERLDNLAIARDILAEQINAAEPQAHDTDRLMLAGINEQISLLTDNGDPTALQAARDQFRHLVNRESPTRDALVRCLQYLIRHAQLSPENATSKAAKDVRDEYLAEADGLLEKLDLLVQGESPGSNVAVTAVGLRASYLNASGRPDAAASFLSDFANRQQKEVKGEAQIARFYMVVGNLYSSIDEYTEAAKWYKKLMSLAPESYVTLVRSLTQQGKVLDAVDLCLNLSAQSPSADVASTLAQLVATEEIDSETYARIQPVVESALKEHGDDVGLLMSVAVMHVTRTENDQAIAMFERIVTLSPKNPLALNNLATLLAERPNRLVEALEYIDRAMTVAGRIPPLLDTRGTILLNANRNQEAVESLEEAVAGGATDPRYYLHLALALQKVGKESEAQAALQMSRQNGLKDAILTTGDREQLAMLDQKRITSGVTQ